jgi:hypothetical protein
MLPQTNQLPHSDAGFRARMRGLWAGIQAGSLRPALPAFFPEAAYIQVKAIGDPAGDFTDRLLADYRLDIAAAHALLGGGARRARLVSVNVPQADAHWVPPNVCDNRIGYYEVPNSRVVYRQGGVERSFGIASLISWRGGWYVVHLGAIVRPTGGGIVADPETGPGESEPSSTC